MLAILVALSYLSFAKIEVLETQKKSFPNSVFGCWINNTCDLKKIDFVLDRKRVSFKGPQGVDYSYLSDMRLAYETSSVEDIEKYAVVQKIRGCQFSSYQTREGDVIKALSVNRDHFGKSVIFQHQTWQIDNDAPVPIYTVAQVGETEFDNFYLLRWNKTKGDLNGNTSEFYGRKKPEVPYVFAADIPGAFSAAKNSYDGLTYASNSSLEFEVCLFKTKDLPAMTDFEGTNINWSKALRCIPWESKYVYNFKDQRFETKGSIDPVCEMKEVETKKMSSRRRM